MLITSICRLSATMIVEEAIYGFDPHNAMKSTFTVQSRKLYHWVLYLAQFTMLLGFARVKADTHKMWPLCYAFDLYMTLEWYIPSMLLLNNRSSTLQEYMAIVRCASPLISLSEGSEFDISVEVARSRHPKLRLRDIAIMIAYDATLRLYRLMLQNLTARNKKAGDKDREGWRILVVYIALNKTWITSLLKKRDSSILGKAKNKHIYTAIY